MKKVFFIFLSVLFSFLIVFFYFYVVSPGQFLELESIYYKYKAGVEENFIKANNYKWFYFRSKDKERKETIVFVHGFTSSKRFWLEFLQFFKDYDVVVPDLPGHGETTYIPKDAYSIRAIAKRLDSFIRKIGLKSFHLVGISLGGGVAGYYTYLYPHKVKKLVLIDSAGVKAERISPYFRFILTTGENILIFKDRAGFNKMMSFLFVKPPSVPTPIVDYYVKEQKRLNCKYEKIFNDLVEEFYTEGNPLNEKTLRNISCPTLIIWGKEDKIIDVSAAYNLNKAIKNSKLVVIENVGHVPPIEAQEFTASKIREFLRIRE